MDPNLQVSRDASRALEEFSDEFRTAFALDDATPWAEQLGYVRRSNALKTTFPIPLSAAGYKELEGDFTYRSLYHRSLSMTTKTWYDGVSEFADRIEAPDFIDWAGEPARIAAEWKRLPNILVANMLALGSGDGPLLDFYADKEAEVASTKRLFAAGHPFNVLNTGVGTFDNRMNTTVAEINSGVFWDRANAYFRGIKGPNGKPLGVKLSGGQVLAHPDRENLFKHNLAQDTLIRVIQNAAATENVAAVTQANVYKNTVGYTIADEFSDANVFYLLAGGKPGLHPWVVQTSEQPEEIIHDKSSEMYKKSLKVAVSYHGKMNVAGCLPQRILRVTITG